MYGTYRVSKKLLKNPSLLFAYMSDAMCRAGGASAFFVQLRRSSEQVVWTIDCQKLKVEKFTLNINYLHI